MSTWDIIEEALERVPVTVRLERREVFVVREALNLVVRNMVESRSAWEMLENWGALNEADVTSVMGLTPYEANLVKQFEQGVQAKRGNAGEVIQLPPKTWLAIIQKIEANSDYYDMLLHGMSSSKDLVQKIRNRLSLDMGKKPASQRAAPVEPPHGLGGNLPKDQPPEGLVHGSAAHQNALGWDKLAGAEPEKLDIPMRKSKVHAQDVESMKGSTSAQKDITGKLIKPGDEPEEDPTKWDLDDEG